VGAGSDFSLSMQVARTENMQEAQWWYANGRQSSGPVDLAGLRQLQREGTVTARTLLWCEGMPSWRPLAELEQASTPIEVAPAPDIAAMPSTAGAAS
ncbi:DUF4339 domain-containing protein, partial [Pseudomonas syringae group genomosp. 7]